MPGRTWGSGSSSSSSSGSSNRSSSSSSNSFGHSSWHSNNNGDNDGEPTDPIYGYIALGILALVFVCWLGGNFIKQTNDSRKSSDATATTHSITLADLAMMHTALDGQLSRWRELGTTIPTHVGAESAGFSKSSNTAEVVYGYCDDDKTRFYVYVLNEEPPQASFIADTEGYAWIKNSTPSACHPPEWVIHNYVHVNEEDGWYFGLMSTGRSNRFSTQPSFFRTPTPMPAIPSLEF